MHGVDGCAHRGKGGIPRIGDGMAINYSKYGNWSMSNLSELILCRLRPSLLMPILRRFHKISCNICKMSKFPSQRIPKLPRHPSKWIVALKLTNPDLSASFLAQQLRVWQQCFICWSRAFLVNLARFWLGLKSGGRKAAALFLRLAGSGVPQIWVKSQIRIWLRDNYGKTMPKLTDCGASKEQCG